MGETPPSRHVFVVRVWEEPSRERPGAWRGSVEHVGTGQRLYFVRLADMQKFILARLGPSSEAQG